VKTQIAVDFGVDLSVISQLINGDIHHLSVNIQRVFYNIKSSNEKSRNYIETGNSLFYSFSKYLVEDDLSRFRKRRESGPIPINVKSLRGKMRKLNIHKIKQCTEALKQALPKIFIHIQDLPAAQKEEAISYCKDISKNVLDLNDMITNYDFELSPREAEIKNLVIQGLINSEISQALFIEEKTVKFHLTSIYRKMNVRNRSEVILDYYKAELYKARNENSVHSNSSDGHDHSQQTGSGRTTN
jgi:DNA-binding CsgD family transcriptional regulator